MSGEAEMGNPTPILGFGISYDHSMYSTVEEPYNGLPSADHLGWVNDPEMVLEIVNEQPIGAFGDTEASEVGEIPKEVFCWKVHSLVTGTNPDEENQGNIGSCVGFGVTAAVEGSLVYRIYTGAKEEFKETCQEVVYGGSRVEIGKGRLGRGDGSIVAWAAQFVKDYGILPRGIYGKWDLSKYNIKTCSTFGSSGVPDEIESDVKKFPVKGITRIRSWEDAKKAMAQGYFLAVGSSQGFTMRRDEYGFCKATGTWQHCMAIWGYQTGPKEGGWIKNSWGANAHTGPRGLGDPPLCGFWAEASVIDRMCRQGDAWAFSTEKGFPKRNVDLIDWSSL